jgi:hypothetical protein
MGSAELKAYVQRERNDFKSTLERLGLLRSAE